MRNNKRSTHIKRVGATFTHYYNETQKKVHASEVTNRHFGSDKARQAIRSESLRFAKRNATDLIDWALSYTLDESHRSNVLLMSGAIQCDTPTANNIRLAIRFSLDVISRFNPSQAEEISYNLVVGVLQKQKPFVKDMLPEQADEMISEAINKAKIYFLEYEKDAITVRGQAEKEQRIMVFKLHAKKYSYLYSSFIALMLIASFYF